MLKLMKYEFKKTMFSKLILLVVTVLAEAAFLVGLRRMGQGAWRRYDGAYVLRDGRRFLYRN